MFVEIKSDFLIFSYFSQGSGEECCLCSLFCMVTLHEFRYVLFCIVVLYSYIKGKSVKSSTFVLDFTMSLRLYDCMNSTLQVSLDSTCLLKNALMHKGKLINAVLQA